MRLARTCKWRDINEVLLLSAITMALNYKNPGTQIREFVAAIVAITNEPSVALNYETAPW
jgi:hypothetical protein